MVVLGHLELSDCVVLLNLFQKRLGLQISNKNEAWLLQQWLLQQWLRWRSEIQADEASSYIGSCYHTIWILDMVGSISPISKKILKNEKNEINI